MWQSVFRTIAISGATSVRNYKHTHRASYTINKGGVDWNERTNRTKARTFPSQILTVQHSCDSSHILTWTKIAPKNNKGNRNRHSVRCTKTFHMRSTRNSSLVVSMKARFGSDKVYGSNVRCVVWIAERRREKLNIHIKCRAVVRVPFIGEARRLKKVLASFPIPPVARGVNDECSTSRTRCSCALFFSRSWVLYLPAGRCFLFVGARGVRTLTSK